MAGTTQYFGISYPTNTDYVKDGASAMQTIADGFDSAVAIPTYNNQTGTSYTFVLTDAGKTVTSNNASAVTFTIPPQASVAWANNTTLTVRNLGAGVVTIAGGAGVTVTNTAQTVAQYGSVRIIRTASNAWTVVPASGGVSNDIISRIPTSVAVGSGSGSFNSASGTVTFTGATSVSVNGIFNSTYDKYLLICDAGVTTGGVNTKLRFRTSGTDNTTSNYSNAIARVTSGGTFATVSVDQNIDFVQAVLDLPISDGNYQNVLKMEIINPFQSLITNATIDATVTGNSAGFYIQRRFGACTFNGTTSFDGLTIYSTSAMTGTLKVMAYV